MIGVNGKFSMSDRLISAQEIIKKYHITYQTINHYTNFGLLQVVTKNGNVRMYDREHIRKRLIKVSRLISEGYPLRLIRKKLNGI